MEKRKQTIRSPSHDAIENADTIGPQPSISDILHVNDETSFNTKRCTKRLWLHRLLGCVLSEQKQRHNFSGRIYIEVMVNGRPQHRNAYATFDTGCPKNLMSRKLAESFGIIFDSAHGNAILEGIGNGRFKSIGRIQGRWACKEYARKQRFGFHPRYYGSTWEVSESKNEPFDVIIGGDTIQEYSLFTLKLNLGFPGYRTQSEQPDPEVAAVAIQRQEQDIKANAEKRKKHKAEKSKRVSRSKDSP